MESYLTNIVETNHEVMKLKLYYSICKRDCTNKIVALFSVNIDTSIIAIHEHISISYDLIYTSKRKTAQQNYVDCIKMDCSLELALENTKENEL